MLPDFPKIKNKWSKWFFKKITQKSRQVSFLAQVPRVTHFEGDGTKSTDVTGRTESSEYDTLSGILKIDRSDLIDRGPVSLYEEMDKIALDFGNQQIATILERVRESTRRTGNVVDAAGQCFNPEHLLSLMEKIEIEFDEDGKHNTLSLVMPPGLQCQLKEKMAEWMMDASFKSKYDEIINTKRQEWHDRESNRKLVD